MKLKDLINNVKEYNDNAADLDMIRKAYEFASKFHEGQKRDGGDDFVTHPLSVAIILSEIQADTNTILAALLHDTIEDTGVKKEDIVHEFNLHVATLVDGVTKINKINFASRDDEIAGNTRKLLSGIEEDIRIILIKLADRLHNMRTLQFKRLEKQREIALETMEIFVPLAYNLGCYRIKSELEDLSLKYLNPETYYQLDEKVKKIENDTKEDLSLMHDKIQEILNKKAIPN